MATSDRKYWLPDDELLWVPAYAQPGSSMFREDKKMALVIEEDGKDVTEARVVPLAVEEVERLGIVQSGQEEGCDDICSLPSVNEAALLHTVRVRYRRDQIYTRIMRTLLAVNPFAPLPIYSAQVIDEYRSCADSMDLPPHIYCIGHDAMRAMQATGRHQAILISGESGAGKTESAKLILSFVAEVIRGAGNALEGIDELVLRTNPVLEAFGNAMTVRNNNSSRFGKWLDLRFAESSELSGCSLTSYLLETTRVCSQDSKERSFHIFYQVLQARKEMSQLLGVNVMEPAGYQYLKNAQLTAPGINDDRCFQELREALTSLGFSAEEQVGIFKLIVAVLLLGNASFADKGEAAHLEDAQATSLREAAQLLGVNDAKLVKCMLVKRLTVGKDVTERPLKAAEARAARDGIARLLYGRLFLWILERLNATLTVKNLEESSNARLLGLLDIAGFENFQRNSLEQLLINLSNEHLQQFFNRVVIKEEMDESTREGVPIPDLGHFEDNADCLALIDGVGGVLALLDEEMTVPKSSDQTYVLKVLKQHERHKRLIAPKVQRVGFSIHHYAGDVSYSCDGWLEKNSDRPPDEATALFAASKLPVVSTIGEALVAESKAANGEVGGTASRARPGRKPKSATGSFRASLRALMEKVSASEPHYIRCIKPNQEKRPGTFNSKMVMEQLLLCGVLATVKIRQQGYPYRLRHEDFVYSYGCVLNILGKEPLSRDDDVKDVAQAIVGSIPDILRLSVGAAHAQTLQAAGSLVAMGSTRVFMKLEVFSALEQQRRRALHSTATRIQRVFRGHIARSLTKELSELRTELREAVAKVGLDIGPMRSLTPLARRRASSFWAGGRRRASSSWAGEPLSKRLGSLEKMRRSNLGLSNLILRAETLNLCCREVGTAQKANRRLQLEISVLEEAEGLQTSVDLVAIERTVAKAGGLSLQSVAIIEELAERGTKLSAQLPVLHALQSVACSPACDSPEAITDALSKAEEVIRQGGDWLPELDGKAAAAHARALLKDQTAGAEQALPGDQPDGARRRRRVAFAQEEEADVGSRLLELAAAAEEYDVQRLERLLRSLAVESLGPDDAIPGTTEKPSELLSRAKKVFEQLQTTEFVLRELDQAEEAASQPDAPMIVLRQLEHLGQALVGVPGLEQRVADAKACMQSVLVSRARSVRRRSVFQTMDREELDLAGRTFSDLRSFSRLKPQDTWAGHAAVGASCPSGTGMRRKSTMRPGRKASDTSSRGMLQHSKQCILESLTMAPEDQDDDMYDAIAIQTFRNVLVCMGDAAAQECQRDASHEAIVELARANLAMRDEIYVQVLKQLTDNPSSRSVLLGWELLHRLCADVPPAPQTLVEFVRFFIKDAVRNRAAGEVAVLARASLLALDKGYELADVSNSFVGEVMEVRRILEGLEATLPCAGGAGEDGTQSGSPTHFYKMSDSLASRLQSAVDQLLADRARLQEENSRLAGTVDRLKKKVQAQTATEESSDAVRNQRWQVGAVASRAAKVSARHRFRAAVRKIMVMRILTGSCTRRGAGFSAPQVVGALEATLAEDDEYAALMERWSNKKGKAKSTTYDHMDTHRQMVAASGGGGGMGGWSGALPQVLEESAIWGPAAPPAAGPKMSPGFRFRVAVRKIMAMRVFAGAFTSRGQSFVASQVVGALEASLAEDEEYAALSNRRSARRGSAISSAF